MLEWLSLVRDRLERAWRALVDEPREAQGFSGRANVLLTGPLPDWMYRAYAAKAREMDRPMADVLYVALRIEAKRLIAHAVSDSKKGSDQL